MSYNCERKCKQTVCCSGCIQRNKCELVCKKCVPEKDQKTEDKREKK